MKPGEREEDEAVREEILEGTTDTEYGRKHAEGAFGGNIGDDVSNGGATGGAAALRGESVAQSALDRGAVPAGEDDTDG